MLPFQMIAGGTYVTTGNNILVECQSQNPPDFIVTRTITGWGEASQAQSIEWWWERSMPQYTAKGIQQASNATLTSTFLATLGISHYDTSNPPTFAPLAATAITGSTGAFVVSMTNTGNISVGDYVRLTGTTGELQIAGYVFQVTAVTVNTSITLGYMASSGITFAADATAASVAKFIPGRFYPHWAYIANITKAPQAVVSFTAENDFTPGEFISFRVSPDFGMSEINFKHARVLSVTNSATESSITIDLDTTGYTTFTFPTSANAVNTSPAVCVPASSGVVPFNGSATIPQSPPGTNLQDAFDNRNKRYIVFGSGLFNVASFIPTVGDTWMWQAYKYDSYNNQ
ncbi:MAG TPA: hypothetical protein VHZ50_16390 [Puia sp.]|jgi:hypothetical protein|nr:hypothetical protein [Puia sp.]